MGIQTIRYDQPDYPSRVRALRDKLRAGGLTAADERLDVPGIVRQIIADVESRGDQALIELTARHDKVALADGQLRTPAERIKAAHKAVDRRFLTLIRRVIANLREYQRHILIAEPAPLQRGGRRLGVRYTPVGRVGVYVPGGRAVYPSTVLMTVVPAQVAGVRQIAIASPPAANGEVNPLVLALAGELGIWEVYRMGGAQAVAALAIGTAGVRAVDKIVGPGNAFVAEAKRQLFGRVGIDSVAGPSEVFVVADETANAGWIAADLLAQAEHDPGSAVLVTPCADLAAKVAAELDAQVETLERAAAARRSLEAFSAIIVVPDLDAACKLADEFAPEHLQLITADDRAAMAKIRNAGAIFLGGHTPVAVGDYYAGPSHVLPTGGTARFSGPLSCNDFLKASSTICYDAASLAEDAPDVTYFAGQEGLTGHAASVRIRQET